MATLERLYDSLFHLSDGLDPSTATFAVPEGGFGQLATLLDKIFRVVKEAETNVSKLPRDEELRYASEATGAAAGAANAAADAADAAARATSISPDNRVAKQAVIAAFRAAGAAYRAAAAARGAAMSAEALPANAELEYHGEVANDFFNESAQLQNVHRLLFHDQQLQLQTSVYLQLRIIGQKAVVEAASFLWDKVLQCLRQIRDVGVDNPLGTLLKIISTGNQTVKALVRQYLLDSAAFHNPDVLERVSKSDDAVDLGFSDDAALRTRNIKLRPDLFNESGSSGSGHQCSMCAAVDDIEVVSGKVDDQANDDFLTFPGRLNDMPIKPLIDTGGGCNLIKLEWLQTHGIEVDSDLLRFQSLLMADGSTSKKCPCIDVKWSFDGRKKAWVDVEFVVVEGYKYDALIGLPFLKHTETIHNSAGRLVFPEFNGVHAKGGAVPIYQFGTIKKCK
ncbi:hypothetical protein DL766_008439 [Monosporascus sp. MC13-8B]|uniref:Fungal N-terminal domain-containing protein n=1 Tax=Monosporascus cannonballus TaxID=155416 RepID=A0ABY0GZB8_9PEZI|nr:hypothetical protein DL763_010572 [Monosporascus cannonballus]RYO80992.1 hypothetical protein DL762_007362 [Monosporascus cannonballus]RYP19458.1 hypothetical protein DL766_008439 [Monosporascus sp. MC13-8B]